LSQSFYGVFTPWKEFQKHRSHAVAEMADWCSFTQANDRPPFANTPKILAPARRDAFEGAPDCVAKADARGRNYVMLI
jgi:hypothetical protein